MVGAAVLWQDDIKTNNYHHVGLISIRERWDCVAEQNIPLIYYLHCPRNYSQLFVVNHDRARIARSVTPTTPKADILVF
jgi:hypothetical protein